MGGFTQILSFISCVIAFAIGDIRYNNKCTVLLLTRAQHICHKWRAHLNNKKAKNTLSIREQTNNVLMETLITIKTVLEVLIAKGELG